jgi:hypothetical protein
MSRYILNEVEISHHLILIRLYFILTILITEDDHNHIYFLQLQPHFVVWGRYCACEILIANPIDWLFAGCLEYFIFFSIDSSEARKQYDEYCLSIMQTITEAHDRTHK